MTDSNHGERLAFLLKGADEFAVAIGLKAGLLQEVYRADTDWAFIIQTDAVIETATREIVAKSIRMEVNGKTFRPEAMDDFVGQLPMNGRASLGKLLRATGCNKDICEFIEAVRQARNAFAHDIRKLNATLLDVVCAHPNKDQILRRFAPIENYNKAEWEAYVAKEPDMLRFGVFDQTLVFLTLAYNIALKPKPAVS